MPFAEPLRYQVYENGTLIQACDACPWAQRGHRSELRDCPLCGASLERMLAIAFGGLVVMKRASKFEFFDRQDHRVLVQAADLPEVLQFMCRHTEDTRTGRPARDFEKPRRIAKRRYFEDHFFASE